MKKHTPGPWRSYVGQGQLSDCHYPDKAIHFTIDSGSRKLMATGEAWLLSDDPNVFDEIKANARLIAAATELLEALEDLVDCVESDGHYAGKEAHDAIKKAKGEQ